MDGARLEAIALQQGVMTTNGQAWAGGEPEKGQLVVAFSGHWKLLSFLSIIFSHFIGRVFMARCRLGVPKAVGVSELC